MSITLAQKNTKTSEGYFTNTQCHTKKTTQRVKHKLLIWNKIDICCQACTLPVLQEMEILIIYFIMKIMHSHSDIDIHFLIWVSEYSYKI